jgi:hypothetical protein
MLRVDTALDEALADARHSDLLVAREDAPQWPGYSAAL